MSVELHRGSPGKFDSRTLSRKTLSRWTGRNSITIIITIQHIIVFVISVTIINTNVTSITNMNLQVGLLL